MQELSDTVSINYEGEKLMRLGVTRLVLNKAAVNEVKGESY